MKLSNLKKYPLFIISGFLGSVVLVVLSEAIGFTKANFVAFAGPSYASWVYPFYFLVSFLIFWKIFKLPSKIKYYIFGFFIIFLVWYYLTSEGQLFTNPIPFGIDAV